jgi:hypothetical protein
MKKWEYYIVQNISSPTHQGIYGHDKQGDRKRLFDDSGMQYACMALNKLGEEGWEIVGISAEGHHTTWTLKRSK